VTGLGIAMFVLWLLGTIVTRTTPQRKWTLGAIRLVVILLLLVACLRPTLVRTELKPQRATLVFLIDFSKSMLVSDSFGGRTRYEVAQKTLTDVWPLLQELQDLFDVKLYAFDESTRPLESDQTGLKFPQTLIGTQSAIGASLQDVLRQEAGKQLAGVFLLTDGAQQSQAPRDLPPQTAARDLAREAVPLYTIVFGQARSAGQGRDVAVVEEQDDPAVFVKNRWTLHGSVNVFGYANQDIPVRLLWESAPGSGKMEQVALSRIRAQEDGQLIPVEFSHLPPLAGEFKVTLQAAEQPGELLKSNNELSTFVTVLAGGLNVLYIEGELRVEQRYLRRALDSSPNIHVDYLFVDHHKLTEPLDLSAQFAKGKYDVIILGDVDSVAFRAEDLQSLAARVNEGTGLLTLGGFHTYWPGGYQNTPLKDVFPLKASALGNLIRQNINEPPRSNLHLNGPLPLRLSKPFGVQSPLMQLADGTANATLWEKLPPLDGANDLGELIESARVLAETPEGRPLLVARDFGSGRVLAFAGDSTWRWYLKGFDKEHRRFWRQSIFWLARKAADEPVYIQLEQRRFSPGNRVEFTAGAREADGSPATGVVYSAQILRPDGSKRDLVLAAQGDLGHAAFIETSLDGDYTISVTATKNGAPLGTAKARFIVQAVDLELANSAARPDLMTSLATITKEHGGRALTSDQLGEALTALRDKPPQATVEREEKYTHWDSLPFMLVLIVLMTAEWFLRKRWGLV